MSAPQGPFDIISHLFIPFHSFLFPYITPFSSYLLSHVPTFGCFFTMLSSCFIDVLFVFILQDINPFCETVNDHHLFSLLKQTAPNPPEVSGQN